MRLLDVPALTRLLGQLAREAPPAGEPRAGELLDVRGPSGMLYDDYGPPGCAPRAIVMAVHGMTTAATRDRRLVHFARVLAASGARCVLPRLPALSQCLYDAGDVDALAALLRDLGAAGAPVGVAGFSYGGSYGLLAAARPEASAAVRFVLSFGAYHHLGDLTAPYLAPRPAPRDDAGWDDEIYLRLVLAWARRAELALPPETVAELSHTMLHYCLELSPADKRAVHDRHLADIDVAALLARTLDPATAEALSPAGKLGGLRCPVSIIHDRNDRLVPSSHARRLHAELRRLPSAARRRLLVTGLLSHVTWTARLAPLELMRLMAALSPLVSSE